MDYITPPANEMRTTLVLDSRIRFQILEVIRGKETTDDIILPGYLSNQDDFNDQAPTCSFVRPNGRAGSCYANTYRRDAQFLLVLKKSKDGEYMVNWYALGPVNEQLRSEDDPWLLWVRQEARRDGPATSDPTPLVRELGTFADALPGGGASNGRLSEIEERRHAVYEQLRVLDAAAAPALMGGLADSDVRVRRGVALYLFWACSNYERTTPHGLDLRPFLDSLIHALRDPDPRVKELSAQVVGLVGAQAAVAVPDLLRMLADTAEGLRNTACLGLAGIGPAARDALPALRKALEDSRPDVRRSAQFAIDKIEHRSLAPDTGPAQPGAATTAVRSAGISGRVTAGGGHPVPGVMVIAVPANGGVAAHAVSGPDGTYEVDGTPEGVYFVDFDLLGFDITRRNHVRVSAKTTAHVDAVLYVSAICECVTVTPKQPLRERVGQALSASGDPLPHARLHVGGLGGEFDYTDGEGRFTIRLPLDEALPLTVSESGFQSATQQVSGAGAAPIVFRLVADDGASLLDTQRLPGRCCPGDWFTHGR